MTTQLVELSLFEAMGLVGVAFYLGSYAALQFGLIDGKRMIYPALNFIAASCVLVSLFENFNMPSLLIQISWITISLYGISRIVIAPNQRKERIQSYRGPEENPQESW